MIVCLVFLFNILRSIKKLENDCMFYIRESVSYQYVVINIIKTYTSTNNYTFCEHGM